MFFDLATLLLHCMYYSNNGHDEMVPSPVHSQENRWDY